MAKVTCHHFLFSSLLELSHQSSSQPRERELGSPLEDRSVKEFVDIFSNHRYLCDLKPRISGSPLLCARLVLKPAVRVPASRGVK